MSSLESDLMQPERQGEETPPPTQTEEQPPQQAAPPDDDAALDKLIEEQSIALPDGTDKLVPLSAVTTLREKLDTAKRDLKSAKEGSAKQQELEERVNQLTQTLQQWKPYVEAYNAALQQAQQQPPQPPVEDKARLEKVAKLFDYYKPDGSLDLDRAREAQSLIQEQAEQIAQKQVAPVVQHSTAQQSTYMRERAKATAFNGAKADPAMIDLVWSQLDPSITSTEQGAKFAFIQALGMSKLAAQTPQRGPDGKFVPQQQAQELPPPMFVEKAGGKDAPAEIAMTDKERHIAKQLGITEKEYLESAKTMPRGAR